MSNFPFRLGTDAAPPPRAEKPWLARPDWAAGKIKSSMGAVLIPFYVMGLVFGIMGGLMTLFVLPKELHRGNYLAFLVLIFPAIGLFLLLYALRQQRGQRRFGETTFVMASTPGALGGALEGLIETGAPFRPEQGLRLQLSCIRRNRGGKNTTENVVWQDERFLKNEAVSTQGDHAVFPVHLPLPAGQPECFAHGGLAIIWRLKAQAKMSGPNFDAMFDVPVFNVAGAAAARTAEPDPTASLQIPIEEVRRDEHSRIQIRNAPGGREFFFPAARNLGMVLGVTAFMLVWSAVVWVLIHMNGPLLFRVVFGLAEVFLLIACFNLWFKQSRVIFHSRGVRATKHWLIFGRTRSFDTGEVAHFDSKIGFTSGQKLFYSIQLITRSEEKFSVGTGIANKPEADWLVQEMNKALGHSA
ncbi:MAG: hypothetical protein ABSA83_00980 [Verrucomicrobiota bacterium]|jgi:hypothetical protein